MENGAQSKKVTTKKKKKDSSIRSIFTHADTTDKVLMIFGLVGAIGDGFFLPVMLLVTSKILNNLGNGPTGSSSFTHNINKNSLNLLYLACAQWVTCFLEGYCWTRTAERQASRMRARYLKAILRQDVEYFDLKGASTADVITSVSSDSLLIQDVLSEKVPNFLMNCSTFFGSYVIGFVVVWRLAIVAFPTVVLLIIPGLMYGRILMSLARKMREDYNKGGAIVEQAISSIRTVYSFVGESKTMSDFSAALENSVKLGLRQGLIKGIAIGSNGITFAIWAILAWYGSRLVMYHGGKGGDIFAVGATSIVGGL